MSLWKRIATPEAVNARIAGTAAGVFGIRITEVRPDSLLAEMPVEAHHLQPFGLLHGGVSVVLSETLGSLACVLTLPEGLRAVGIEINANHLAAVTGGQVVTAECRPFHVGRRTQVWQTEIRRADGRLACVSRLTCAVVEGEV
ncbi:PaaI family thioesterase [Falsiroseomonas oryzae]|uniref:PaaI family thioesterase n=1 Tax=Falsiroseomonas oryzae TaxID=2766473 RepID=UPI0022EA47BB|nr:hotdog fold thioesterase [Roseomonas sp. MO-31]